MSFFGDELTKAETPVGLAQNITPKQPNLTEVLQAKKARLEEELARVNNALGALSDNPQIERVLNLVQQAARGY